MIRLFSIILLAFLAGCAYTVPMGRVQEPDEEPFNKSRLDAVLDSGNAPNGGAQTGWHWQSPSGLDLCPGSSTPYPGTPRRTCK